LDALQDTVAFCAFRLRFEGALLGLSRLFFPAVGIWLFEKKSFSKAVELIWQRIEILICVVVRLLRVVHRVSFVYIINVFSLYLYYDKEIVER
jgi:hypothetical protein